MVVVKHWPSQRADASISVVSPDAVDEPPTAMQVFGVGHETRCAQPELIAQ
jgi:hypothetical protein